jgi:hypothetical protein
MYRTSLPALLVLGAVVAGCTDQNDPTALPSDRPPIAAATRKPRGGGFDNANNVGSINGTQWGPSPWTFTGDVSANGSPCWDLGFCAVGNIVNPDFLAAGVLDFGAASNPDPNPAEGCVDPAGNPSVKCYALLSTTNFFEDITDDNVVNPVEIKTLRSGIQTTQNTFAEFPNTVLAPNTGWQLNFDYAVLTQTPPAGPSTDAYAAVYLDYDSNGDGTLDQTTVVLQVFRSDLEQGKVPLKAGGCGTYTLGGVASSYPLCTGWQFRTFDASFLGGKLFRIRIIADEGGIDPGVATSFAIDNLKFEETVLVSSASAQPNPAPVNTAVTANGSFTDTEIIPHTATIDWGDGNTTAGVVVEPGSGTPGAVSGTHNYVNPGVYSGAITVSDGSGAPGQAKFSVTVVASAVIDIRPAVTTNQIFLRFNLPIPVLLFGGPGFNVRRVPVSSLRFGPAGARPIFGSALVVDANRDGFPDLLSTYLTRQTGIQPGATQACLSGTAAGVAFQGCDAIKTVGTP